MGVDYTAHAIIGVKIPKSRAYAIREVRACNHELPTPDCKFCPHCGKPVKTKEEALHPFLEKLEEDVWKNRSEFTLLRTCHYDDFYVGVKEASTESNRSSGGAKPEKVPLTNIESISGFMERLQRFLPPELWDEREFGLWAVLNAG